MSPRPVVAAAIVDSLHRSTRLLAAQRSYPARLAGFFELPGGKVEAGETPKDALRREIAEELGTELLIGEPLAPPGKSRRDGPAATDDPGFAPWPILEGRVMWVWLAEVGAGAPAPAAGRDHQELVWVDLSRALNLPWLPTNLPIVKYLQKRKRVLRHIGAPDN